MFLWNIAVTSLAEVWIEIASEVVQLLEDIVTSLAEVWIEIRIVPGKNTLLIGHFPCGSVD